MTAKKKSAKKRGTSGAQTQSEKPPSQRGQNQGKKVELDEEQHRQAEVLASFQCTQEEISAVLGISLKTFKRLLDEKTGRLDDAGEEITLRSTLEKGRDQGKASLRRMQWAQARAGRVGMLVWLGKQYLGQRDVKAVEVDVPDAPPGGLTLKIEPFSPDEDDDGDD